MLDAFSPGAANRRALQKWIVQGLHDASAEWSAGTYGAIAEFSRDADEPAEIALTALGGSAVTARGGIHVALCDSVRAIAYEMPAKHRDHWSHAITLCLPAHACAMGRRPVVTELGPDAQAIRPGDRRAILFDLGLGAMQVDVCVRTSEPDLLSALRAGEGRALFDTANPAMMAILAASPHRVFLTRIGRAEVYQPIPPADGKSPDGPHTHLLPKLLRSGRTHAATVPIPADWVPCLNLFPPNPTRDGDGVAKPFDRAQFDAFQDALDLFGDQDLATLKRRVRAQVASGASPDSLCPPDSRFARAAVRIALRQIHALDGPTPSLARWREQYDRAEQTEESALC